MTSGLRIGVMGAGAVGCYVGGCLAAIGEDVVFLARDRIKKELDASGLALEDLDGASARRVRREALVVSTDASALCDRDVVLCCVKSAQTAEAAAQLAGVLGRGVVVVSMQNGVRNADALRVTLTEQVVLGGIVGFNVISKGDGVFRRATSGPLVIEASADARVPRLASALRSAGFEAEVVADIRALQWSKLIMNLNNAVSALSDRPTKELLFDEGYRRILAAIMAEALGVLRAAGVRTARLGALPVSLFPYVLRLPTALLRVVASAQLKIDPEARSSMWEDLSRGRRTEVDELNGEIVRLADASGVRAPLNARMVEAVREAEAQGGGSPKLSADALWAKLSR